MNKEKKVAEEREKSKENPILSTGIIITIIGVAIVIVILPLFLDMFIFGNNVKSALSNGEWASFLGSYLGGVLGGICTLITVVTTIKIYQKQLLNAAEEKTIAQQEKAADEKKKVRVEIAGHLLGFISDIEKWIDIENKIDNQIWPFLSKKMDIESIKMLYLADRQDCYGSDIEDFISSFDMIQENRYRYREEVNKLYREYTDKTSISKLVDSYPHFGDLLDKKIQEYDQLIRPLQDYLDTEKRRMIIGNTHYLYLEIMLSKDHGDFGKQVAYLYDIVYKGRAFFLNTDKAEDRYLKTVEDAIEKVKIKLLAEIINLSKAAFNEEGGL